MDFQWLTRNIRHASPLALSKILWAVIVAFIVYQDNYTILGVYSLFTAKTLLIGTALNFGASQLYLKQNSGSVHSVKRVNLLSLLLSIFFLFASFLLAIRFLESLFLSKIIGVESIFPDLLVLSSLLYAVNHLLSFRQLANHHVGSHLFFSSSLPLLGFLISIFGIYYFGEFTAHSVPFAVCLGYGICVFLNLFHCIHLIIGSSFVSHLKLFQNSFNPFYSSIFRASATGSALLIIGSSQLDKVIASFFITSREIGVYSAAISIASIVGPLNQLLDSKISPTIISLLQSRRTYPEARDTYIFSINRNLKISFVILLVGGFLSILARNLMPERFSLELMIAVNLLLLSENISLTFVGVGRILQYSGKHTTDLLCSAAALIILVISLLTFSPIMSVIILALVVAFCRIFSCILKLFSTNRLFVENSLPPINFWTNFKNLSSITIIILCILITSSSLKL